MKLDKEVNAARRQRIWDDLKKEFPGIHEHGLLQAFLESEGLTYYKQGDSLRLHSKHFKHVPFVETVQIHIRALDVIQTRGIAPGTDKSIGYWFTESKNWKPKTLASMKLILSVLCNGDREIG